MMMELFLELFEKDCIREDKKELQNLIFVLSASNINDIF